MMEINKDTRIADILNTYGDIAEVMEVFGIQRVGRYSVRALAAKALTVEWAARIHRVPLDEFLVILNKAVAPDAHVSSVSAIREDEGKP
jgi:hypothetical protein